MTDMERAKRGAEKHGLEVSVIGHTLQWVTPNAKVVIQYFDKNGNWIKTQMF